MPSLQEAIDNLYNVAVRRGLKTSKLRLSTLADFCVEQLGNNGISDAGCEVNVPGFIKKKDWDVGWEHHGKCRLGISLKSNLSNLGGVAPNAIDNLLGEVTDAQMISPEIVTGYIMVIDVSKDSHSNKHGCTWSELLKRRLSACSIRKAPTWTHGTIEASHVVEVDFSSGARLITREKDVLPVFKKLKRELVKRNPCGCF